MTSTITITQSSENGAAGQPRPARGAPSHEPSYGGDAESHGSSRFRSEEFEAWWAEGKRALAVLERQLAGSDYLVGGAFSIADICLFAYTHRAGEGGWDMTPYPAIGEWCRRIQSRAPFIPLDRPPVSAS